MRGRWGADQAEEMAERWEEAERATEEARDVARRLWREIVHGTDCVKLLAISGNVVGVDEEAYPWLKEENRG